MKLTKEEISDLKLMGQQIAEESQRAWAKMLVEEVKEIRIQHSRHQMLISVKDLREILSMFEKNFKVLVPLRIAYQVFIVTGIKLKGFHPSKTALRVEYKLPLEKINELLPGSYKVTDSWRTKQ